MVFESKTFHFWPFGCRYYYFWRGFIEKTKVDITDNEVCITAGNYSTSFPVKELEIVIQNNRWYRLGNPKITIGTNYENGAWIGANIRSDYFYLKNNDIENFISDIKSKDPICFSPESKVVTTTFPWYRIDKLITGNRNSLWLNTRHIISSEDIEYGWCVNIKDIKYFFTRGIIYNNLYIGSDKNIRLSCVSNSDVKEVQDYILLNGGNIAAEASESHSDSWSPKVIFSPSLWFCHSSIGFTDTGVVFKQKTFKTNDNIFLPYDKINLATYKSKWYWIFTKDISIFGEQNILPRRRYSKTSVSAIQKVLEANGVKAINGVEFCPSYHSSWFGILLSIITLSVYHWLIVAAGFISNRNTLTVGDKKMAWNGKIYGFTADKNGSWNRKEMKNLTTLALDANDVKSVVYIKKHWYHLWGYLFIWAHPYNIRVLVGEASQHSVDYDLEMCKIWSWNVSSVRNSLKDAGFEASKELDKFYKKWAKTCLLEKYK